MQNNTPEIPSAHFEDRAEEQNATTKQLEQLAQELSSDQDFEKGEASGMSPTEIHEQFAPAMISQTEFAQLTPEEKLQRGEQLRRTAEMTLESVDPEELRAIEQAIG